VEGLRVEEVNLLWKGFVKQAGFKSGSERTRELLMRRVVTSLRFLPDMLIPLGISSLYARNDLHLRRTN